MVNYKKPDFDNYYPDILGDYQKDKCILALSHVENWSCALDIGGHVGHWSVNLLEKFAQVHIFEPIKENFTCLKENIGSNPKAILHNIGLSNKKGELDLYLEVLNNSGSWTFENNKRLENKVTIKTITLDSLNLMPSFIKIDVQNHEYFILQGAINTLKKHQPIICLESRFNSYRKEIIKFLTGLGYQKIGEYSKEEVFKIK